MSKINYWKEFVLTFSNKKSLLSSKKIERFIAFNTFLVISVIYLIKHMEHLKPENLIEIIGVWLTYGGYNSFMNYRDKKIGDAPKEEPVVEEEPEPVVEEEPEPVVEEVDLVPPSPPEDRHLKEGEIPTKPKNF